MQEPEFCCLPQEGLAFDWILAHDNNNRVVAGPLQSTFSRNNSSNNSNSKNVWLRIHNRWWPLNPYHALVQNVENTEQKHHDPQVLSEIKSQLHQSVTMARLVRVNSQRQVVSTAIFRIFLWSTQDRIIVMDIDGTITKSTMRGALDTILVANYEYCHQGVCQFLQGLGDNCRIVYLSSRPIGLVGKTRDFLRDMRQGNQEDSFLPEGPLWGFPGSLAKVVSMELLSRSTHEFKRSTLEQNIIEPFQRLQQRSPLVAAFGNTHMDMRAYHEARVSMLFWIDPLSNIYSLDSNLPTLRRKRKDYERARGMLYKGYQDGRLVGRLQDALLREANTSLPII